MSASSFWEAGYKVFGLHGAEKGVCNCGWSECQALYKHPVSSGWQYTPHWSDEQFEVGEQSGQFASGYGVLIDSLLVIDVDARNGGVASYEKLITDIPEISGAGLIVETGSGGGSKHLYFAIESPTPLMQHHSDYPGIDFKSSGFVVGPGSRHASGNTYKILSGDIYDISQAPSALIELLRKPAMYRAETRGVAVDINDDDIINMLSYINADCDYDQWVRCGMAVHNVTGGTDSGLSIWDEWSATGGKYPGVERVSRHWHSFGKASTQVTIGTLMHYAELGGWRQPVEFSSNEVFDYTEPNVTLDTSGIDLMRPPGFIGKVTQWINSQCIFPRETLAVAAALACVSNVAGMRYTDALDGSTPNLFAFGVAGSATGKESILKAHNELMRAAGLSAAVHGGIKSEQEIYRNMARHQGVFYVVDELGEQLVKISNAMKRGGASYLEGVIGTLMSAYSKANSHMLVTGDLKEEVRASLQKERASVHKQLESGHNNHDAGKLEAKMTRLDKALDSLDMGIVAPYVSILGLTTPERFDALMDYDMAVNGFMGRAIIFREMEDNPTRKPRGAVCRTGVPDQIRSTLQFLYAPGYSEVPERVECVGERTVLQTRPDAEALLDRVGDAFWELAEQHKQLTGLSAIPRRGYEQVAKVSMILAIPEGLRTVEHVMWAYALVKRDIDNKLTLANANSAEVALDALASTIMGMLTTEHGETTSRIARKCRKYARPDIDKTIELLITAGYLRELEETTGGRPVKKYYSTGKG